MNQFKSNLLRAKNKQRKFFVYSALLVVLVAIIIALLLISSRATKIIVTPNTITNTSKISISEGIAFSLGQIVYSISENVAIAVNAEGYYQSIYVIKADKQENNIKIKLQEKPITMEGLTNPEVADTKWFVDGIEVGNGSSIKTMLFSGNHQISLKNPYYLEAKKAIITKPGKNIKLEFNLKPIDGAANIYTNPENAEISVNGNFVGTSPLVVPLEGGIHKVAASLNGYNTTRETIEITKKKPKVMRNYNLSRLTSTLSIFLEPKGGTLIVNGKKVSTDQTHKIASNTTNTISYFKEGYLAAQKSVKVAPSKLHHIKIILVKDIGELQIDSVPSGTIFINGKDYGTTPSLLKLPAIMTDITIRRDGYQTFKTAVTPSSKGRQLIDAKLRTKIEVAKSEAPNIYTNKIGIKLKLYYPSAFVMGAPRGETGQRANEILRKVVLNKAFYAGMYEISNSQFKQFYKNHPKSNNLPVNNISWAQAALFCNWLSKQEGLEAFYIITKDKLQKINSKSNGYRMLSEAEWEWLARKAGRKVQTIFPWGDRNVVPAAAGNVSDESANGINRYYIPGYNDGYPKLAPIGSYKIESNGVYDMVGNVSEWVTDFYSLIPEETSRKFWDPLGPEDGDSHVIKGSSWRSASRSSLRAAYRQTASGPLDSVGFRIGRYLIGDIK